MKMTTYNNPYHPFPYEMRGQCVEKEENNKTRFFEIFSIKYDKEKKKRLEELGELDSSILGEYLKLLGRPIAESDDVFYLYRLETYYADPEKKDPWLFNESITSYSQYVFPDFDELLEFVNHKWGLALSDFIPIDETNIPN